jgi:hypothetical protein
MDGDQGLGWRGRAAAVGYRLDATAAARPAPPGVVGVQAVRA